MSSRTSRTTGGGQTKHTRCALCFLVASTANTSLEMRELGKPLSNNPSAQAWSALGASPYTAAWFSTSALGVCLRATMWTWLESHALIKYFCFQIKLRL